MRDSGSVVSTNIVLILGFVAGAHIQIHLSSYHKIRIHARANSANFIGCIFPVNELTVMSRYSLFLMTDFLCSFKDSSSGSSLIFGFVIATAGIKPEGEH